MDRRNLDRGLSEPLSVQQSVREDLEALNANEMEVIPGKLNRVVNMVTPGWMKRVMDGKMLKSGNGL